MDAVIEVEISSEMALEHYLKNFTRMFGKERVDAVVGSVNGSIRFYGLEPVGMELSGLERHQRLIQSYQKLHQWRASK
jgi:ribosomal protein S12 methylthiotransferase accessory factor